MDNTVRHNPDGSITVGVLTREVKPKTVEVEPEAVAEEKPAPKKGGRPKKK